jgi:hypothetical protein
MEDRMTDNPSEARKSGKRGATEPTEADTPPPTSQEVVQIQDSAIRRALREMSMKNTTGALAILVDAANQIQTKEED